MDDQQRIATLEAVLVGLLDEITTLKEALAEQELKIQQVVKSVRPQRIHNPRMFSGYESVAWNGSNIFVV